MELLHVIQNKQLFPHQQHNLLAFQAFTRNFSLKRTSFQLMPKVQLEAPVIGPSSQNDQRNGRMPGLKSSSCHQRSLKRTWLTISAEGHHLGRSLNVIMPMALMQWWCRLGFFKGHFFHFIKWMSKATVTLLLQFPPMIVL